MIGAGGHARVLRESLGLSGIELSGYVATTSEPALPGVAWLGPDDALAGLDSGSVWLVNGVGSAGDPRARIRVWDEAKAAGFTFATVIDPRAIVHGSAELAEGAQVLTGAIIGTRVSVGADCIINTGAIVDHDVALADHVHVSPGAVIAGGVTVGRASHVGLGARVIQGVSIGSQSIVGAGAVVLHDIADGELAVGVPAVGRPRS